MRVEGGGAMVCRVSVRVCRVSVRVCRVSVRVCRVSVRVRVRAHEIGTEIS